MTEFDKILEDIQRIIQHPAAPYWVLSVLLLASLWQGAYALAGVLIGVFVFIYWRTAVWARKRIEEEEG